MDTRITTVEQALREVERLVRYQGYTRVQAAAAVALTLPESVLDELIAGR